VVRRPADAVERRVAQVDIGIGHVNLRAKDGGTVFELAVSHLAEARQVLVGAAGTERAVIPGVLKSPRAARICSGVCSST
jgi:hypothetical protein